MKDIIDNKFNLDVNKENCVEEDVIIDSILKESLEKYCKQREGLVELVSKRLEYLNYKIVSFLESNNVPFSCKQGDNYRWVSFNGKTRSFNIQCVKKEDIVDVTLYVFSNHADTKDFIIYKVRSEDDINKSFDRWVIQNCMKYLIL